MAPAFFRRRDRSERTGRSPLHVVTEVQSAAYRIARLTITATLSYVLALAVLGQDGPKPLLAPLTALLVVQFSIYRTIRAGILRVGAVTSGVLVAVMAASTIGFHWWTLGLTILGALTIGHLLRLHEHVLESAISAMLVFALGTASEAGATTRVLETLIGAATGLAATLLVPSVRVRPAEDAEDAVENITEKLPALIAEIADGASSSTCGSSTAPAPGRTGGGTAARPGICPPGPSASSGRPATSSAGPPGRPSGTPGSPAARTAATTGNDLRPGGNSRPDLRNPYASGMRQDEDSGRVTLATVADQAGVSISTVSKVLNGREDVASKTRVRVEQLLDQHGYRRGARSAPDAPLIEIVLHEIESLWTMELIRGVESVAKANGASVVLTESGTRHSPGPEWIGGVLRRRPIGVVLLFSSLAPAHRKRLRARSIPFVIIDPAGDPEPDVPSVGSANWSGGLAATRHLIDQGHRRIAIITGPADMLCSVARLDGFRSAMGMAGLEVDPAQVAYGDFHVEGGYERAMELLGRPGRPTAIFAGSDLQALGVLEAARVHGLRVPDDLSVVGYDDVAVAPWASPALTTVHQPLRQMAEAATQILLGIRAGEAVATRMELSTSLVVRKSTAPPPGTE